MNHTMKLGIAAAALFLLSVFSYMNSTRLGERFNKGQKFLPNLNPDEIAEVLVKKGSEETHLKRVDKKFEVVSKYGYPARNESINRLINDILEIGLAKEVGKGAEVLARLGLEEGNATRMEFSLKNDAGKEMVRFLVGKNLEEGGGTYVLRTDQPDQGAYLSEKTLYLTVDANALLEKEILNLSAAELQRIQGPDFILVDRDGTLQLEGIPSGKQEKTADSGRIKSLAANLSFDAVHRNDDAALAGLAFQERFVLETKLQTGYRFQTAEKDGALYLRVEGFHTIQPITLSQDDPEEEVKRKSELVERAASIETFNQFHGSWTYKLADYGAQKFKLSFKDLIEDKKSAS